MKATLHDLPIKGQKILMRVDFNVPISEDGTIRGDSRIKLTLPSIQYILSQEGKLILISHLGRPKGKKDPRYSLKIVAKHLEKLLGKPVQMADDCIGPDVKKQVDALQEGEVLLLENIRFHEGEEHPEKDPEFVEALASLGDLYINDAFGTAHRAHASTSFLAKKFPKKNGMGFLMEKEISYFSKLLLSPKRPFYAVIGGAKVSTKIGILEALTEKIDGVFIGGGMVFTFLKALGVSIGDSLFDAEALQDAEIFLKSCKEKAIQVLFPNDFVIAKEISESAEKKIISAKEGIPEGWKGVDIGPETIDHWNILLKKSATVFWNGPMGVFELPRFAEGTRLLAQTLSTLEGATVVVGGGDSVAAVNAMHLQKSFTHISTGGGASLEYIEFGHLPGIDALSDR